MKIRYCVDYNFEDSKWGRRPNNLRFFATEAEAIEFAKTTDDGIVTREERIDFN